MSSDRILAVKEFAEGSSCSTDQQQQYVFDGSLELLRSCEELIKASLNRRPLGMGILTGIFSPGVTFAPENVRSWAAEWFAGLDRDGVIKLWLEKLDSIREILTSGGRTLALGVLAWLMGVSPATVPIPGFRSVEQVKENTGAMEFDPLHTSQFAEINSILLRNSLRS